MDESKAIQIMKEVGRAVIGKQNCIIQVMAALLAKGHILIEDIPGVGKTTLAMAFSRALGLDGRRMQFTPDVMPADIVGFSLYRKEEERFVYQPGAVMCNIFLADEINRTSPKTQSALLEVMEEGRVSVDGETRQVPQPFMVLATQNPVGSAGTQLLPESQMDRFVMRITMGYPDTEDEIRIVKGRSAGDMLSQVRSLSSAEEVIRMQEETEQIYVHDILYSYMTQLTRATRKHPMVQLGASPRGTIALARVAKAIAYLQGRDYVVPRDVQQVAVDVLAHRLRMQPKAAAAGVTQQSVIQDILKSVPEPSVRRKQERSQT